MKFSWRPFSKITKTGPAPQVSTDPVVENSLNHSLKDARSFAVMTGIGETYLSAFGIFLRATTPQIGLLASLPPLLGSFIQPVSAWLGRMTGARRTIVLAGAMLGGYLGTVLPTSLTVLDNTFSWGSALLGVFAVSTVARALMVFVLLPRIREVRRVRPIKVRDLIFRVTRVNALAGMFFEVVATKPRVEPEVKEPGRETGDTQS